MSVARVLASSQMARAMSAATTLRSSGGWWLGARAFRASICARSSRTGERRNICSNRVRQVVCGSTDRMVTAESLCHARPKATGATNKAPGPPPVGTITCT